MSYKYFALFIGILLSTFPIQYFNENASNLEKIRGLSSGEYLKSDIGSTRYQAFGEGNNVVVLVAASNGYLEQWNQNIEPLVNAGYKVVAYDLFGRGLSDRPRVNLELSVFRDQLGAIIDETGAEKVHLIGSSFGSIIASDYALNNSDRVKKVVFTGPAGWPSEINNASLLLNVPIIGELIFHYFGNAILKPRVEGYFYNKEENIWAVEEWQKFASYSGFMRSYLSTLRHSPVLDYIDGSKKLGALNKPTLFIWGKEDISFPFSNSKKVATLIPHAEVVGVDKAAHWVNIEQSVLVNKAILSFLIK